MPQVRYNRGMNATPRRWFRFRLRTLFLLTLLLVAGSSFYSYWSDYAEEAARRARELLAPEPGQVCTVVLRGDALGLRMPATPLEKDGVANYVRGRFVMMNDAWLKLDGYPDGEPQQWIPRANVLLIEVGDP
jgi:hypothetical protein